MRKRTRKVLSLLIAASMVCAMNTAAFAEEAVDIEAAPAEEDMIEIAVDDSAAIETDAAVDETGAGEADAGDATVDEADDAAVDAETAGTTDVEYYDGLAFDKNGKLLTDITYASNGDKKNPKNDIVTIKNTTDPVSWNNFNARNLLYTVLFGDNETAEHLNYTSTATASKNYIGNGIRYDTLRPEEVTSIEIPKGARYDFNNDYRYLVEPLEGGSNYLLVGYRLFEEWPGIRLIDDENGKLKVKDSEGDEWLTGIPVTTWDGRKIDYNKSGLHKYTTSKKEVIDIGVSIVTFNNGTVTELPGVSVKSVKVDRKTQKQASVALENKVVSENLLSYNEAEGKTETVTYSAIEYDKINDLPYFTFTATVKGSDVKTYKKDVNKILKDKKFYYGIAQNNVMINFSYDDPYYRLQNVIRQAVLSANIIDADGKERTAYDLKIEDNKKTYTISGDTAPIEKEVAEMISDTYYFDSDVDSIFLNGGYMRISKFNGKKAVINLRGWVGDDKKDRELKDTVTLKPKKDYTIDTTGSIAGTTVNILDFPAGGNLTYGTYLWGRSRAGDVYYDAYCFNSNSPDPGLLASTLGYKYAFRKSPVEKSKKFRGGIFAKDNVGFVQEAE